MEHWFVWKSRNSLMNLPLGFGHDLFFFFVIEKYIVFIYNRNVIGLFICIFLLEKK